MKRLLARIPDVLGMRLDTFVAARKREQPKYSLNDAILDGLRLLVDGAGNRTEPLAPPLRAPIPSTVAEKLAAMVPGVRRGAEVFGANSALNPGVNIGDAPVEDVPTRPWLPVWKRVCPMKENDPGTFWDEINHLAPGFRPTQAFWKLSLFGQASWLDENHPLEAE